ncbi:MAG TPA: phosphoribosylformylglycinamidine synthase subunit PurQ [Ignavibacteriaceae bacterium]|nr:phosphoribosylformylglycinamidine synthase subunit PurQ [Ignavibacteriaceae bacterium]
MKIRFGVVVFPGSNCDHDAYYSVKQLLGNDAEFLWHKEHSLKNSDVIILPGGFSYGDYLRSGAIAKLSPLMNEVTNFAEKGGIVIGICNGFQILTESGLLPGVLLKNDSLKFACKDVFIKVTNKNSIFTKSLIKDYLKIPIAHGEGNYFADEATLTSLKANNQIVFKYCNQDGEVNSLYNPNGSIDNIAGIVNKAGNVLGMMPHPERVCNPILGNTDGVGIFKSIMNSFK